MPEPTNPSAARPGAEPAKANYEDVVREKRLYGIVGEFDDAHKLLDATRAIRDQGYTKLDAMTPFPVHGIDDAMRERRSILGRIVLPCGLTGTTLATLLIWYTGAIDYPLVVGGKPLFAFEPSIPIMFEATVLLSAFAAIFGMLFLNGLPRFYHPFFNHPRARRATDDGFFLVVESTDPRFDAATLRREFERLGARSTELVAA